MNSELIKRLNPYLLFAGYINENNIDPQLAKYPERIVKWYELEFVVWGNGFIETDGEKIPAIKNTLFIRYPGMKVQGYLPYSSYLLVYDLSYDSMLEDKYNDGNFTSADILDSGNVAENKSFSDFKNYYLTDNDSQIEKIFKNVYRLYSSEPQEYSIDTKIYLLQLILQIQLGFINKIAISETGNNASYYNKLEELRKLIETDPSQNFTLKKLADMANLSPNFFCKLFSDNYKISLFKFINKCRINMSKSYLSETSDSISQISQKCGFENDTYFYRVFKEQTGITPSQFRERSNIFKWEQ